MLRARIGLTVFMVTTTMVRYPYGNEIMNMVAKKHLDNHKNYHGIISNSEVYAV